MLRVPATADAKPSVLFVDDVEANLIAGEALLEGMHCTVVRARSGNEALRLLLKQEFAVMLLDVQMPSMDGYEVAQFARQNPATRDVPIIFLTAAQNTDETLFRAYGTGAVDFLTKPANPHVLRSKVQVFLDLYTSRQRLAEEVKSHKKTLDELERANAALRHFTHAAAHDLGAPLRAVRGFLQALTERIGDQLDADARDYVERLHKANDRMSSLLNSLLAYARLSQPVAFEEVDCAALLDRVATDLADPLEESKATLSVGSLPVITAEADRIYQLFLNLIGNANKFRRPSGAPRIAVSAERRNAEWVFCVEDDGIGIEPEYQAAVFEPFRRLHSQSSYSGTGLGLTLCREIVEQHGGRMWVESNPGGGSRFYFTLAASPSTT